MRLADQLPQAELSAIVSTVQQLLYLDRDDRGQCCWDPDKSWNGADVCDNLAALFAEHGLAPEEPIPLRHLNQTSTPEKLA